MGDFDIKYSDQTISGRGTGALMDADAAAAPYRALQGAGQAIFKIGEREAEQQIYADVQTSKSQIDKFDTETLLQFDNESDPARVQELYQKRLNERQQLVDSMGKSNIGKEKIGLYATVSQNELDTKFQVVRQERTRAQGQFAYEQTYDKFINGGNFKGAIKETELALSKRLITPQQAAAAITKAPDAAIESMVDAEIGKGNYEGAQVVIDAYKDQITPNAYEGLKTKIRQRSYYDDMDREREKRQRYEAGEKQLLDEVVKGTMTTDRLNQMVLDDRVDARDWKAYQAIIDDDHAVASSRLLYEKEKAGSLTMADVEQQFTPGTSAFNYWENRIGEGFNYGALDSAQQAVDSVLTSKENFEQVRQMLMAPETVKSLGSTEWKRLRVELGTNYAAKQSTTNTAKANAIERINADFGLMASNADAETQRSLLKRKQEIKNAINSAPDGTDYVKFTDDALAPIQVQNAESYWGKFWGFYFKNVFGPSMAYNRAMQAKRFITNEPKDEAEYNRQIDDLLLQNKIDEAKQYEAQWKDNF